MRQKPNVVEYVIFDATNVKLAVLNGGEVVACEQGRPRTSGSNK